MVPSHYVVMEAIPLTTNGKVDRKALPHPEPVSGAAYTPPGNDVEERLVELWAEVLGIDSETIGIHDNFFDRGGHSLRATQLVSLIEKAFGKKIPLAEIFEAPTIHQIAGFLDVMDWLGGQEDEDTDSAEGEEVLL
jgi:acyl carrier protein